MYDKYLEIKGVPKERANATRYLKAAAFYATCFETGARGSAIINCRWNEITKQTSTFHWFLSYKEQKVRAKREQTKK